MFRPIAISLSPNTQKEDFLAVLHLLLTPWVYIKGSYTKKLESWFKKYFQVKFAFSFDSGRSAEFTILSSLEVGKGDEVLIQAFTCVAVPNSILWTGAKPVYVDIERDSFNMDPTSLEQKITPRSKAVIVQHTFGMAAQISRIKEIAKKNNLVFVEDCAHSLGATFRGKKIGTFGDVSFFSFGRDKIISSVFGGMVIVNDEDLARKIARFQRKLSFPSRFWVAQQLLHPVLFAIILPTYNFLNLGKVILRIFQKLHLLSLPVSDLEKKGKRPVFYPKKLPNALARLALLQLAHLENFNKKRREITRIYVEKLGLVEDKILPGDIFLRFPILVENPARLFAFAKKRGIILGDWYSHVVDPKDVSLEEVGYKQGSCPVAEEKAAKIVNLPTYPRLKKKEVEKVLEVMKELYGQDKAY